MPRIEALRESNRAMAELGGRLGEHQRARSRR